MGKNCFLVAVDAAPVGASVPYFSSHSQRFVSCLRNWLYDVENSYECRTYYRQYSKPYFKVDIKEKGIKWVSSANLTEPQFGLHITFTFGTLFANFSFVYA